MASPRKTSTLSQFPFNEAPVCWVLVQNDGVVRNPTTPAQRMDAITLVRQGKARLFIAWPGRTRTDLFEVDDIERHVALLEEEVLPGADGQPT